MKTKTSKTREKVMQGVFTACACISILAVALICIFLFANGVPTIFEIGPLNFLLFFGQGRIELVEMLNPIERLFCRLILSRIFHKSCWFSHFSTPPIFRF